MRRAVRITAVIAFALAASPVYGQEVAKEAEVAGKTQSRALQWAADTGKVAGAATFCAMDTDVVEEYISIAQAKIAATANDNVDRVVARIEFGNIFNVASSQEPLGGCENFAQLFPQEARKLN